MLCTVGKVRFHDKFCCFFRGCELSVDSEFKTRSGNFIIIGDRIGLNHNQLPYFTAEWDGKSLEWTKVQSVKYLEQAIQDRRMRSWNSEKEYILNKYREETRRDREQREVRRREEERRKLALLEETRQRRENFNDIINFLSELFSSLIDRGDKITYRGIQSELNKSGIKRYIRCRRKESGYRSHSKWSYERTYYFLKAYGDRCIQGWEDCIVRQSNSGHKISSLNNPFEEFILARHR